MASFKWPYFTTLRDLALVFFFFLCKSLNSYPYFKRNIIALSHAFSYNYSNPFGLYTFSINSSNITNVYRKMKSFDPISLLQGFDYKYI